MKEKLLYGLNTQQKQAVTHKKGPLLIIAGAGTGKTKVITQRIAYLIKNKLAKPEEILALTFTEKAAEEMETRVDILLPYGTYNLWVMTFHSFGERLLKEYSSLLGISSDYKLLDKIQQLMFLREHIYELPLKVLRPVTNPSSHIYQLATLFSRLKEENIDPKRYIKWAKNKAKKAKTEAEKHKLKKHLEAAKAYKKYNELLRQENALDFADLIFLSYKLLKEHPDIRKKFQQQFQYILVDEFQDTNYLQNEILKLLVNANKNITVVGDDDQSIFRWRGAALSNIINFQKDFPKAKKIVLSQNYRSAQEILDLAYKTIQHNNPDRLEVKAKINKRLIAEFGFKNAIHFNHFEHSQAEADFIVQKIKESQKKGTPLKEIAVLVRSNHLAQHYIKAFNKNGVPYIFSGESGIYFQPEISMLISFIKTLASNNDWLAYYNLAQSEAYSVDLNELAEIFDLIRRQNLSVFRTFTKISSFQNYLQLTKETIEKIETLAKNISDFRQLGKKMTAGQILYEFLKKKKLLKKLNQTQNLKSEIKLKNIADFFNQIIFEFEKATQNPSIWHLAEYLDDLLKIHSSPDIEDIDPDLEAVKILTFHAAKGLEFAVVFLPALTSDYLPTREKTETVEIPLDFIHEILPEGDHHLQEERRLFYVGITRAKKQLFLSYALDYGGKRLKKPSPFLYEALGRKTIANTEKLRLNKFQQIELFASETTKDKTLLANKKPPLSLSAYSLDDYLTCPLKYKFARILRVPVMQSYPVAFGASIHNTINEYYKHLIRGKKLNLESLLEIFSEKWQKEGYLHKKHEREAFREGEKSLKNFINSPFAKINPISTEEPFSLPFGKDVIRGKFDLVIPGKKGVRIIDFKTSSYLTQEVVKQRVRDSFQLKLYAWAYYKINKKMPESIGLVFLTANKWAEITPRQTYFPSLEKKIKEVSEGIEKKNFEPNPSSFNCQYCAFRETCPFAYR
ncbi:ATP-dependent helicase [bacterium]|nr:ATP-dependent helicase [bacterium]